MHASSKSDSDDSDKNMIGCLCKALRLICNVKCWIIADGMKANSKNPIGQVAGKSSFCIFCFFLLFPFFYEQVIRIKAFNIRICIKTLVVIKSGRKGFMRK